HLWPPGDRRISIERTDATFRDVGDVQLVTLSIGMTSTADDWHDARFAITVPHAARVLGMIYSPNGRPHRAELKLSETARDEYAEATRMIVDPALLAWTGEDDESVRLELSVFPLSLDQHPSVDVIVALPRTDQVSAYLATQRFDHRAGTPVPPTA